MTFLLEHGDVNKEIIMGFLPEDLHVEQVFIESSQESRIDVKIETVSM